MAFTITPLSLFRYTCELEKTHHLIVTNCGCMNKLKLLLVVVSTLYKYLNTKYKCLWETD
jgi:hypothetical protein